MTNVPLFPRGFLLSATAVTPPPTYTSGPLLPNFYVHPWTGVDYAGDRDMLMVVLGTCVPTHSDRLSPAADLLEALRAGESELLKELNQYAGRHAIMYGSVDAVKIINDATAMRSVFYAAEGGVISSHALLVERALGGHIQKDDLPFKYGYPGNRTPYSRTLLLTANTLYEFGPNKVRRFWPRSRPTQRTVKEVAAEFLDRSATALQNIARTRPIKVALTAGLDSRALIAIAIHSGIDFDTYTYGNGPGTLMDRNLASDLAAQVGVKHNVVPALPLAKELHESLDAANYSDHHKVPAGQLSAWINNPETAAVTAHLLEIGGRNFVQTRKLRGTPVPPPNRAADMAFLHYRTMGGPGKRQIAEWGESRYFAEAGAAFQQFIEASGFPTSADAVHDPFDQFYWEHRMSSWHGPAMNERDFYAEAFIPFNSRSVFEALHSVPADAKLTAAVVYHAINMVDERLLNLPVNPQEWPPAADVG